MGRFLQMPVALLAAASLMLSVTPGSAADCATFQAIPATASLTVVGPFIQSSKSPMNFCSVQPGEEYVLWLRARGFETRRVKFGLSSNEQKLDFSSDRLPCVARSIVFPGWGQRRAGHSGALSNWTLILTTASVLYSGAAYNDYRAHIDQSSSGTYENYFVNTAILTGWIYGWNLVETFLLAAPLGVTSTEERVTTVKTPRRSNTGAIIRSIFFPGMGQIYLDKEVTGTIFQGAFIASGVWAIEAAKNYAQASTDSNRDLRDASLIVMGSVWLLNVIEAGRAKGPDTALTRFEFETSYRNSVVRTGISVKL